jgi:hypothetical protein
MGDEKEQSGTGVMSGIESAVERLVMPNLPQACCGCLRHKTDCPVQGAVANYAMSCIHRRKA